jgi:Cu/Ag efflux protein CusF
MQTTVVMGLRTCLLSIGIIFGAQIAVGQSHEIDQLQQQKFEFEKQMEIKKFQLEIVKVFLTVGSIGLPLIIGIYTITRQIKPRSRLKKLRQGTHLSLKQRNYC